MPEYETLPYNDEKASSTYSLLEVNVEEAALVVIVQFYFGGFYKFISDDFSICFEQIAVRNEGAMRAL